MSVVTPAYTGGESVVGIARESTWGTPPTGAAAHPNKPFGSVASPAKFVGMKEESFEFNVNADPQLDDMIEDREVQRVIANGNTITGALRLNPGPESIGYFLTWMFGSPLSTLITASSGGDNDVYSHVWYPGYNTRANWPAAYSVESRLSSVNSKLIMGAIPGRLGLEIPNNGVAMLTIDNFIGKSMQMLGGAGTSGTADDEGTTLPCILTADPTLISETPFHFKQMTAYPQIDAANEEMLTSISFDFAFPDLRGLFTGGSGQNLGTYALDKFQISGRANVLFQNDDILYKVKQGTYMAFDVTLRGDVIQGSDYNSLRIQAYSALSATPGLPNRVGDLAYDLAWTGRKDPTEGKSCKITLQNSVISYAV